MKKSEIKIFKEEYEAYKADLLYHQEELKKCKDYSDKSAILADISFCKHKIEHICFLNFIFNLN